MPGEKAEKQWGPGALVDLSLVFFKTGSSGTERGRGGSLTHRYGPPRLRLIVTDYGISIITSIFALSLFEKTCLKLLLFGKLL